MRQWEKVQMRNRAERALRQSIRPHTDVLPLIDDSSEDECEVTPEVHCGRCSQLMHANDRKCANCGKPCGETERHLPKVPYGRLTSAPQI